VLRPDPCDIDEVDRSAIRLEDLGGVRPASRGLSVNRLLAALVPPSGSGGLIGFLFMPRSPGHSRQVIVPAVRPRPGDRSASGVGRLLVYVANREAPGLVPAGVGTGSSVSRRGIRA